MTRSTALLCLATCLVGTLPVLAAPPANNNFAARINLGNAVSVTRAGTTVEATLEAGEVNPGNFGGASVWYRWTAPADSWVTVDTVDIVKDETVPRLDTVLAVFTGTSLTGLTMLGFNDSTFDSFDQAINDTSGGASRLTFLAEAGVTYSIAVHGADLDDGEGPAEGPFTLCIESIPDPAVVVYELNAAPASVNVTAADRTMVASIITGWTGVFSASCITLSADSPGSDLKREFPAVRSSSTAPEIWKSEFDIDLPAKSMAGTWPVSVTICLPGATADDPETVTVWSQEGNDAVEDSFLVPDTTGSFTVVNTGVQDPSSPQVTGFEVVSDRDLVNPLPVAGPPETMVAVRLSVADEGSGLSGGVVVFQSLADDNTLFFALFDEQDRVSGSATDGVYEVVVPFDKATMASVPGIYSPLVLLFDKVYNESALAAGAGILEVDLAEINVFNGTHPFKAWNRFTAAELGNPAISGPTADPDKDGVANAIEYALGRNPKASEPSPTGVAVGEVTYNAITYKSPAITFLVPETPVEGARYYIEASNGLGGAVDPWVVIGSKNGNDWRTYATLGGGDEDDPEPEWITVGEAANGFIPVTVRYASASGRGALRLRVEILAP